MIWGANPRLLRITTGFVAGLARLEGVVGKNLDLLFASPKAPPVSDGCSGVSRSSTQVIVSVDAPALTDTKPHPTLLAPAPKEPSMDDAPRPSSGTIIPANDEPSTPPEFDAVVMTLARLLGRQMAREQFLAAQEAANAPASDGDS